MTRGLLSLLTTISIFGQNYNVSVHGISVAKANWNLKNDKIQLKYNTNGIADFIWPADNIYSTVFDTLNYNFIKFNKKIKQGALKQSISIQLSGDSLIYKNDYRIRPKSIRNLFSLLVLLQKNYTIDLDTKWLKFEHEGVLLKGRFLSAGLDTVDINGKNIVCEQYRMDIKKENKEASFFDQTDRLMSYSVKENTIRQIWVERNGNRRIIKANILANGFPFKIDIQNE